MNSTSNLIKLTFIFIFIPLMFSSKLGYSEIESINSEEISNDIEVRQDNVEKQSTELEVVAVILPINCYGANTGGIDLSVFGGSGNYTFEWSNGATTEDIYDLADGLFEVVVTDSEGNTVFMAFNLIEPLELSLDVNVTHLDMSTEPIGSIDLTVTGGTAPYTFDWTGPDGFTATTKDISNLTGGTYSVIVTDNNGCINYLAILVSEQFLDYFMACPNEISFECIDDEPALYKNYQEFLNAGGYVKSDCSVDGSTFRGERISRYGTCPTTIVERYRILDHCGKEMVCFHTIIIDDNTNPRFPINPYPTVVECIDDVPAPFSDGSEGYNNFRQRFGDATDNCGIDVSSFMLVSETVTEESCPKNTIIRRQYSIHDLCGNSAIFNERIEVIDEIAPETICPASLVFKANLADLETLTGLAFSEDVKEIPLSRDHVLGISFSDNCEVISLTYQDVAQGSCLTTITRTFTVSDGCNEASCSQTIELDYEVVAEFTQIGPLCQNSHAPALPTTSENGITGTWTPDVINTSEVGTFIYTFEPNPNQCAAGVTVKITIVKEITPEFDPIGTLCLNDTPPALPAVSTNGISGIWNPAVIETSVSGTQTYLFTPDAGQCAGSAQLQIEILEEITPEFDPIGPFCVNESPAELPTISNNGIKGIWSPSIISTTAPGIFEYVFTPDQMQCVPITAILIEVIPNVVPSFNSIGSLCQFSTPPALPNVSLEGIDGTWSPAEISTAEPGLFDYIFTPNGEYVCSEAATINIEVNPAEISVVNFPPKLESECYVEPYSSLTEFYNAGGLISSCWEIDTFMLEYETIIGETCPKTIVRAYTVIDANGNFLTFTNSITINDQTNPRIYCPPDTTIDSNENAPMRFDLDGFLNAGGSISDNCENDSLSFGLMSEFLDTLANTPVLKRTYYVADECLNYSICLHQITIENATPATLISNPGDIWLNVFPNPNDGRFKIQYKWNRETETALEIIDASGKMVLRKKLPASNSEISNDIKLNSFTPGVYFLKISDGENELSKRFIIN